MIQIIVQDASWCKVMKHPDHWDTVWDILSYTQWEKNRIDGRNEKVKRSFFDRRGGKFGTGLLPYLKKHLDMKGEKYKIKNKSDPYSLEVKKTVKFKNISFEDYQKRILNILNKEHRTGIFQAPTGSGKSIITAGIIEKLNRPATIIVVPRTTIAKGMRNALQKTLNQPIGMIGQNIFEPEYITVVLYQSLQNLNLKSLNKTLEAVIIDEAHLAPIKIKEILEHLPDVYYRFGLTATAITKDDRKNWLAVTSQLGKVLTKVDDEEAKSRVTDVDAYMAKIKLKQTQDDYNDIFKHDIILNKQFNELLIHLADTALDIKENCLLLVDHYEQAKLLKSIAKKRIAKDLQPVVVYSKTPGHVQDKLIKDLSNSKVKFVIATPVWGVGTDIPGVESIVLGSARKKKSTTLQKIGRGRRRTNKKGNLLLLDVYIDMGLKDRFFQKYSIKRMDLYTKNGWFRGFLDD
ncbi:MAG: DEAD/DEAH box helicase family protein [Bacteroidales bacterium]|nr:DEAD/DEAH box helicase family protein [Bacteroidales bacterium]